MSEIQVNTINEYTGASGVTIDGLLIKDGAIPSISGGKVLQVVQGTHTDNTLSITSNSFTATGLSASITPSSTSNKILIAVVHHPLTYAPGDIPGANIELLRDTTQINTDQVIHKGDAHEGDNNSYMGQKVVFNYLDSPSSTSSITYSTKGKYIGTGIGSGGYFKPSYYGTSTITLMEIGG
jgi:hypothetical protein